MWGESPREAKILALNCGAWPPRSYRTKWAANNPATAAVAGQASWQQLAVCVPLGQQPCDEGDSLATDDAHSDDIGADTPAKATSEPWRVTASNNIRMMSWRFMASTITR
jgi:hypothetical protein